MLRRVFLGLMLSAEFCGLATGILVFWVRPVSVPSYKLNIIGCSEPSVLPFLVARLAYYWPKSMLALA
jgi:hypothetical protein